MLPPSPPGDVDPKLAEKLAGLRSTTQRGHAVNEHIRNAKSFRNPDLLEKLVEYFDVRESGTNYPPELYDPDALAAHEYYDKLEEARRKYEERQARKPGQPVQFVGAGGGGGGGGGGAPDAPAPAPAPADPMAAATAARAPPPPPSRAAPEERGAARWSLSTHSSYMACVDGDRRIGGSHPEKTGCALFTPRRRAVNGNYPSLAQR